VALNTITISWITLGLIIILLVICLRVDYPKKKCKAEQLYVHRTIQINSYLEIEFSPNLRGEEPKWLRHPQKHQLQDAPIEHYGVVVTCWTKLITVSSCYRPFLLMLKNKCIYRSNRIVCVLIFHHFPTFTWPPSEI
jgi:hypothetical protein